jgi:hypothetical protein
MQAIRFIIAGFRTISSSSISTTNKGKCSFCEEAGTAHVCGRALSQLGRITCAADQDLDFKAVTRRPDRPQPRSHSASAVELEQAFEGVAGGPHAVLTPELISDLRRPPRVRRVVEQAP